MKIASVVWNPNITLSDVEKYIQSVLSHANKTAQNIIVFPGLLDSVYSTTNQSILNIVLQFSKKVSNVLICPGSYFEQEDGKIYHSSCFIQNGEIVLKQRQLYLAKWERELGLSRGSDLSLYTFHSVKIALIISTDVFYPQVTRYAALQGVHLVLSPVAIIEDGNISTQISGLWQNVQQNTIFGVESGYKGTYNQLSFYSESMIHGPIDITEDENGILASEQNNQPFVSAIIQPKQLQNNISFQPLKQLNPTAYTDLF